MYSRAPPRADGIAARVESGCRPADDGTAQRANLRRRIRLSPDSDAVQHHAAGERIAGPPAIPRRRSYPHRRTSPAGHELRKALIQRGHGRSAHIGVDARVGECVEKHGRVVISAVAEGMDGLDADLPGFPLGLSTCLEEFHDLWVIPVGHLRHDRSKQRLTEPGSPPTPVWSMRSSRLLTMSETADTHAPQGSPGIEHSAPCIEQCRESSQLFCTDLSYSFCFRQSQAEAVKLFETAGHRTLCTVRIKRLSTHRRREHRRQDPTITILDEDDAQTTLAIVVVTPAS